MAEKAYTMIEATFLALTRTRAMGFDSTADALEKILVDIKLPSSKQSKNSVSNMHQAASFAVANPKKAASVT